MTLWFATAQGLRHAQPLMFALVQLCGILVVLMMFAHTPDGLPSMPRAADDAWHTATSASASARTCAVHVHVCVDDVRLNTATSWFNQRLLYALPIAHRNSSRVSHTAQYSESAASLDVHFVLASSHAPAVRHIVAHLKSYDALTFGRAMDISLCRTSAMQTQSSC